MGGSVDETGLTVSHLAHPRPRPHPHPHPQVMVDVRYRKAFMAELLAMDQVMVRVCRPLMILNKPTNQPTNHRNAITNKGVNMPLRLCDDGKGSVKLFLHGYARTTNSAMLSWPFVDIFWYRLTSSSGGKAQQPSHVVELSGPTLRALSISQQHHQQQQVQQLDKDGRCMNGRCTDPSAFNASRSASCRPVDQGASAGETELCACVVDPSVQVWRPLATGKGKGTGKPGSAGAGGKMRWALKVGSTGVESELRMYFFGGMYVPGPPLDWLGESSVCTTLGPLC